MEIAPVPHRPAASGRGLAFLAVVVLAPLLVLVFLPSVFGLERYVIASDSMKGDIGRGSLVLEERVPATELDVGDVITFRPPGEADAALVTHRIVAIRDGRGITQGDANAAPDPWEPLDLTYASYPRVILDVPFIGYPFLGDVGRGTWLAFALIASGALALTSLARPRREPRTVHRAGVF